MESLDRRFNVIGDPCDYREIIYTRILGSILFHHKGMMHMLRGKSEDITQMIGVL